MQETSVSEKWVLRRVDSFWRSVAKLGSGSVVAQALLILSFPILSRLYSPSEFALWGTFAAYITIIRAMIHFKFEDAIVAQKGHQKAWGLLGVCWRVGFVFSIVSAIAFYLLVRFDIFGFGVFDPRAAVFVLAFHWLMIIIDPLRQMLIRSGRFSRVSSMEVYRGTVRSGGQIGFGMLGLSYFGLILSEVLSRAAVLCRVPGKFWSCFLRQLKRPSMRFGEAYQALRRFPLYVMPSALLYVLIFNLGTPLVNYSYGSHDAGLYALIARAISLPLMLLGNTIADVFYQRLAKFDASQHLERHQLVKATAKKLVLIGSVLCLGVLVMAPFLLDTLLGAQWAGSGRLAAIIAPWLMMQIIVTPLSRVLYVLHKQGIKLLVDVVSLFLLVVGILLGGYLALPFTVMLSGLSLAMVLMYAVYLAVLLHINHQTHEVP